MRTSQQGFSLAQILITIAVLAVLAVVAVLLLNPREAINQSQDGVRIDDLRSIYGGVGLVRAQDSRIDLGSTTLIYLSLIDPTATSSAGTDCTYFGLGGGGYHCAASSSVYNIDGTGWVPVDFTKIGAGTPFAKLPADPINTATSGFFYAYATDGATWELQAPMAAAQDASVAANDGGSNSTMFEVGDIAIGIPFIITIQQPWQTQPPPSGYQHHLVVANGATDCGRSSPYRCITSGSNGWSLWWGTSVNTYSVVVNGDIIATNPPGCSIGSCIVNGTDTLGNPFNLAISEHTWSVRRQGGGGRGSGGSYYNVYASGTWTFSYTGSALHL